MFSAEMFEILMRYLFSRHSSYLSETRISLAILKKTHIFRFHDVAALADRGDGLVGVGDHSVHFRGHRPRFAVAAARVRHDFELDAARDGHFSRVTCKIQIKIPKLISSMFHSSSNKLNNRKIFYIFNLLFLKFKFFKIFLMRILYLSKKIIILI